jgi:L-asparaginase II
VAVATPEGDLVARLGDPEAATFVRSAAKPFQCLPLLLAGAAERFALSAADVALICASHSGSPEHVSRAADLLARGGYTEGDLLCGPHWPLDGEAARELRRAGAQPTALHNNCSGKHAGMLLACRLADLPVADYVAPDHPWQERILDHVSDLCGAPRAAIGIGVDGCSVPAYRMPLLAAARGYAVLAHPPGAGRRGAEGEALGAIVAAMTGEPEMVAGRGRFTTRLMRVTGGRILAKEGAEGFYGLAVRGPVALGVAIKIADGGERARDGVVLDVLRQLGSLSGAELAELADLYRPVVFNRRRLPVGEVVPEVELEEV